MAKPLSRPYRNYRPDFGSLAGFGANLGGLTPEISCWIPQKRASFGLSKTKPRHGEYRGFLLLATRVSGDIAKPYF
jgi:hypothetical protein